MPLSAGAELGLAASTVLMPSVVIGAALPRRTDRVTSAVIIALDKIKTMVDPACLIITMTIDPETEARDLDRSLRLCRQGSRPMVAGSSTAIPWAIGSG